MPVPKKQKVRQNEKKSISVTDIAIQEDDFEVREEGVQLDNTKQLKTWSEIAAIKDPQEKFIFFPLIL